MAKPQKKKTTRLEDIELLHDAWKRFEGFVKAKVRTTPLPKKAASRAKPATRKSRKSA